MFKIVINQKKLIPKQGDIIVSTLSESDDGMFYVNRVLDNGVIIGRYIHSPEGSEYPWYFGDNYAILSSNYV